MNDQMELQTDLSTISHVVLKIYWKNKGGEEKKERRFKY